MLSYQEAQKMLMKCSSRKLALNTYLREENGNMVIRFWNTDIITINSEAGCSFYTLNSGGWRTSTTKDRLNRFSPANVWQEKGVWYIYEGVTGNKVVFEDGIKVNASGKVISGAGKDTLPKVMRKVDRLVSKYIKGYAAHVMAHGLEEPSGADCWGCYFKDTESKEKEVMGYDHYLNHFEEKYYVPSILAKAVQEMGYGNPAVVWQVIGWDVKKGRESYHIKHALRKYFRARKQGIADELMQQQQR